MNIEKAIKSSISYLKFLKETNNTPSIDIKLTTAIEILEKQLPKEPIEKQFNLKGDLIGLCPVCKVMWCIKYKEYCANCGQKLDWSEVENE